MTRVNNDRTRSDKKYEQCLLWNLKKILFASDSFLVRDHSVIAIVEMEKYIEWSVLRGIGKNLNPFPLYAIVRNAPLQTGKVATSDVLIVGTIAHRILYSSVLRMLKYRWQSSLATNVLIVGASEELLKVIYETGIFSQLGRGLSQFQPFVKIFSHIICLGTCHLPLQEAVLFW